MGKILRWTKMHENVTQNIENVIIIMQRHAAHARARGKNPAASTQQPCPTCNHTVP